MGILNFLRRKPININNPVASASEPSTPPSPLSANPPLSVPALPHVDVHVESVPLIEPAEVIRDYDWHSPDPIYYTFVHRDATGTIFYAGLGTDDWAWQPMAGHWPMYVKERLEGKYEIEILAEDLTHEQAKSKKNSLLRKHWRTLINIQNPYRPIDFEKNAEFHRLRNANREFCKVTRNQFESSDLREAVNRYRIALEKMSEYTSIRYESGIVAELTPPGSDVDVLNRLTLCLWKLGRYEEVIKEADQYFAS